MSGKRAKALRRRVIAWKAAAVGAPFEHGRFFGGTWYGPAWRRWYRQDKREWARTGAVAR